MSAITNEELFHTMLLDMMEYESGVPHRIQHFIKVHALSKLIGEMEGLDPETQKILEITAIFHDVGIRPSLQKYNSSEGLYQEKEGAIAARKLLEKYPLEAQEIDRICAIIGRHHTYHDIDGMDFQILMEADFLVNICEDKIGSERSIRAIREDLFQTKTGCMMFDRMYPLPVK